MRISPLAAAAAGLLLLAGCGAPASSEPPTALPTTPPVTQPGATGTQSQEPADPAADSVEEFIALISGAPMTTYTMDMTMSTEVEGTPMEITTVGEIDNTDPATRRSHMKMNVSGMDMEVITIGGDSYMKMALLGDQWMKMDDESAKEIAGSAGMDMGEWATKYADTIEKVEVVGEDTVGGVPVTQYRVTMRPEAFTDLGVDAADLDPEDIEYNMWVDADGFTRKLDMKLTTPDLPASMVATMDNFNEPLDIQEPKDWVEAPA